VKNIKFGEYYRKRGKEREKEKEELISFLKK
jgi:hypothetical protein